jgi:dynein heavy chain
MDPGEGVWIHGLYLEGASWNKGQRYLEENRGKELHYHFPNLKISVNCPSAEQKAPASLKKEVKDTSRDYVCPVYKYPMRSDKYLITKFNLRAEPPQEKTTSKKNEASNRDSS